MKFRKCPGDVRGVVENSRTTTRRHRAETVTNRAACAPWSASSDLNKLANVAGAKKREIIDPFARCYYYLMKPTAPSLSSCNVPKIGLQQIPNL
jgi:hypothetical protein